MLGSGKCGKQLRHLGTLWGMLPPWCHVPSAQDAKILVANTPMDTDKIKIYGARVRVDSMAKVRTSRAGHTLASATPVRGVRRVHCSGCAGG
jgi:hypothetical protein